jgi:glucose 1-dehydrogenase
MKRLEGKIALVTGAARGIGRGIALCLAEEGASIALNDLPTAKDNAEATAKEIAALGSPCLVHYGDISDAAQVKALVQAAVTHFGKLDIAVANAAFSIREPVIEAKWEHVLRTLEVCQFGTFHTCQAAAKQLVKQGQGGKIIIISSLLAEVPFRNSAAYNMAKAAVSQFGNTLAAELCQHRINVNMIYPGYTDTPGERKFASDEALQAIAKRLPWQRLGTPRDIGRAAVFLASDDADYMTGSTLLIDGGFKVSMKMPYD